VDITVRSEQPADYSAIAGLTYNAFVNWDPAAFKAEPLLVDVLRHNAGFDPELSLVAECQGRIVGHVLLSPFEFVVLGTPQLGTFLAPLCVDPAYQRGGIGGMLIERGHDIARKKGYGFSMLCGHPEYYPRFGYRPRMFSLSGCRLTLGTGGDRTHGLEERPVLGHDIPWIAAAWRRVHGQDDLAMFPGATIGQWFSHAVCWRSSVLEREGRPVAYVRYGSAYPIVVRELLLREGGARDVLAYLLRERHSRDGGDCKLSMGEAAVLGLFAPTDAVTITADRATSDAFMIKVLDEGNRVVSRYCDEVAAGRREPGIIAFPPALDMDA